MGVILFRRDAIRRNKYGRNKENRMNIKTRTQVSDRIAAAQRGIFCFSSMVQRGDKMIRKKKAYAKTERISAIALRF